MEEQAVQSQFRFPRTDLIGKEIEMNLNGPLPGAAYDETRRARYRTRIVDAGNMTGGPVIHVLTAAGVNWRSDQFGDWRIVEG